MNKELEALQSYVQSIEPVYPSDRAYQIIKSALERLEKLEKVWKITKTKRVALCKIVNSKDYLEYNQFVYDLVNEYAYELLKITETEFNLLKEMLK